MKKIMEKVKRRLAVMLIVILSINSLAAVVSDNDGSAFVTNLTSGKVIRTPNRHRL